MKYVLSRIERKSCLHELERFMSDWVCLDNVKLFHIAAGDLSEFNDCVSQQTFINEVTLLVPLTKWLSVVKPNFSVINSWGLIN